MSWVEGPDNGRITVLHLKTKDPARCSTPSTLDVFFIYYLTLCSKR